MISVVILTKNSSCYLHRCLQVLAKFPEVVIVDNGSTDNTLEIARRFPNTVIYEREFCGFGPLKNIGAELAANDWVLFVDSDEVLHPELVETILNLTLEDNTVYQFYRKNYYDNLLIDGCSWDNDYVTRLYNRRITGYNHNQVHESINTKGLKVGKLSPKDGFIYHFPYTNTAGLMVKLEQYAQLYAANNYGKKTVKVWTIPFRGMMAFFKNFVLKKGFLYGYEGLAISAYNSMGVFVKYLKLYELSYKRKIAVAISIDDSLDSLWNIVDELNQQELLPEQVVFLVDDKLVDGNKDAIASRLAQQLVIPAKVIGIANQDSELILNSYLVDNPHLDGVILYYDKGQLANRKCVYTARSDLRLGHQVQYGEMFVKSR